MGFLFFLHSICSLCMRFMARIKLAQATQSAGKGDGAGVVDSTDLGLLRMMPAGMKHRIIQSMPGL